MTIGYPGWSVIYSILLSHLDRSRTELILETGTNWGCTTIILAQALRDAKCEGKVVTIELEDENVAIAKDNIQKAGLSDLVQIETGDSRKILPHLDLIPKSIRVAFLDASHLYDDVLFEFETLLPKLTDDALVFMDNTYLIAEEHEDQRVNGALATIKARHGGNLLNFEYVSWFTPGLALWQKTPAL